MDLERPSIHYLKNTSTKDNEAELFILDEIEQNYFPVKRLYFIKGKGVRGAHYHKNCKQAIIAIKNTQIVKLTLGKTIIEFLLNPMIEFLIIPSNWHIELNLAPNSITLALASEVFSKTETFSKISE